MQARAELERLISAEAGKNEEESLKELQKKVQEEALVRLKMLLSEMSKKGIIWVVNLSLAVNLSARLLTSKQGSWSQFTLMLMEA